MKNSIKLVIAFISILSFSCADDVENTPAITHDPSLKLLTPNSGFNLVLDETKLNNLATTFVWEDPANPTGTTVTYTVETAVGGTDFATPISLGTTTEHYMDITVGQLDTTAKSLGLTPLVEGQMDVRITSSSGTSNYFTLKVTPFEPYKPNWGIIGDATPSGWGASTAMTFNPLNGTYSISLALTDGYFKFRLDDSWTTNYGDNGNNLSLESGGDNIPVAAGNYTIVLDIDNHSYTITAIPAAWGIIGDATPTGWASDTLLDFNPVTLKYSIVMKLKVGYFKFRLDHAWDTNYGDDGNNLSLDSGGSNIAITTPGTYYITTDFTGLTYTITQL